MPLRAVLATHPELEADILLQWIYARAHGNRSGLVTCFDLLFNLTPNISHPAVTRLVEHGYIKYSWELFQQVEAMNRQAIADHQRFDLEQRRLHDEHQRRMAQTNKYWVISPYISMLPLVPIPYPPGPDLRLTKEGIIKAEYASAAWADRVVRNRTARGHLLRWLYEVAHEEQQGRYLDQFLESRYCIAYGHFFTRGDAESALAFLLEQGFARKESNPGQATEALHITSRGIHHLEQGDAMEEQPASKGKEVYYNINAPISGANLIFGDNRGSQNYSTGVDVDSLRTLMAAVTEALPGLKLEPSGQKTIEELAGDVMSELSESRPDRSRLQSALATMRDLIKRASNQAIAAVISAAIDYERAKMGLPPSG